MGSREPVAGSCCDTNGWRIEIGDQSRASRGAAHARKLFDVEDQRDPAIAEDGRAGNALNGIEILEQALDDNLLLPISSSTTMPIFAPCAVSTSTTSPDADR